MTGKQTGCGADPFLSKADFAKNFNVSRETLADLEMYEAMLRRWQPVKNIVAPETLAEIWPRHFADSAQLHRYIKSSGVVVDLGSGGGFPGLVLAILTKNDSAPVVHLVESNARKCAFMRDVARALGIDAQVHAMRIESFAARPPVATVDAVVSRALAPLPKLFSLASPFFAPGTKGWFLKGRSVEAEIAEAARSWRFGCRFHPSVTDPHARVLEINALEPIEGRQST